MFPARYQCPLINLSPTPSILPSDPYNPWQNDVVREIVTTEVVERDGSLTQTLLLTLNKTYVYQLYEDEYNYYIALVRPKDVYEKIVDSFPPTHPAASQTILPSHLRSACDRERRKNEGDPRDF